MNNNVYIMSLEGTEIYEHQYRNDDNYSIKQKYIGMIPYSLELRKLREVGLKVVESKKYDKLMTRDLINVKFDWKVKKGEKVIEGLREKIEKQELKEEYKEKLLEFIKTINSEIEDERWNGISSKKLREKLYTEGFKLDFGNGKKIEYVVYKRTGAKSRTGQVLFIRKQLKNKMIKWSRLGMNLGNRNDIDYPSLLAYESLVSSSIEDIIKINPDNILIVDDVKSNFKIDANVVKTNEQGILKSFRNKEYIMENDLYDGEGLLDSSYFKSIGKTDKGMMLLRQHMFKSCVFNTNIQQFLKDHANKKGIDFNTYKVKNMFGEEMYAKDIHMIITPNSLKALKFSFIKGSRPKMWNHWKKKVKEDDSIFGICKFDKQSKRGKDQEGNILNQTSYQMLNSMPISYNDMKKLSQLEVNYIEKLKNDDSTYIEFLKDNDNEVNSNMMFVDIYNRNNNIVNTKVFKNKRKKDIHNYISHCKRGKIRLVGDYCTIVGNPVSFLYHSIGVDDSKYKLKENEVYTTLHPFGLEYVAFRNPHTSPSNVLVVKNKNNDFISKYFNLSENIICVNAIDFPLQRILSGSDYDSDTLILLSDSILLKNAKKCFGKYRVCVNEVDTDSRQYIVDPINMAKIDNILSESQRNIGTVVNIGQFYMSTYWDLINNHTIGDKLNRLLEGIDITTILSEIAIDSAKRMYEVDVDKQIRELKKSDLIEKLKPIFFKSVSENNKNKNKYKKKSKSKGTKKNEDKYGIYNCPVDYLNTILDDIDMAQSRETIKMEKMLNSHSNINIKARQRDKILSYVEEMGNGIRSAIENIIDEDERYEEIDNVKKEYIDKINKFKIKEETMSDIVFRVFTNKKKYRIGFKDKTELLNTFYKLDKEMFLNIFKSNKKKELEIIRENVETVDKDILVS
ncbi:hypothetical protein [Senegalia massiliensis]|uniref:Uncharacterized protein n=1 Tax=Senegalia massiliensis TaxID=1720316 RepID=A0A845QZM6_9CLOT|nr:hypothetical protein [Senegalia massiliensis]NBI06632.1 hypothetical protein [Senegalia massiliensis]